MTVRTEQFTKVSLCEHTRYIERLIESDLTKTAVRVGLKIAKGFRTDWGYCCYSIAQIARWLEVTDRAVIKALAALREGGFIVVRKSPGNRNHYIPLFGHAAEDAAEPTPTGCSANERSLPRQIDSRPQSDVPERSHPPLNECSRHSIEDLDSLRESCVPNNYKRSAARVSDFDGREEEDQTEDHSRPRTDLSEEAKKQILELMKDPDAANLHPVKKTFCTNREIAEFLMTYRPPPPQPETLQSAKKPAADSTKKRYRYDDTGRGTVEDAKRYEEFGQSYGMTQKELHTMPPGEAEMALDWFVAKRIQDKNRFVSLESTVRRFRGCLRSWAKRIPKWVMQEYRDNMASFA